MTRHLLKPSLALAIGLCSTPAESPCAESPPPEIRRINVTLVTDTQFRKVDRWRGLLRGALDQATEDLRDEAGLVFVPADEVLWEPPEDVASLDALLTMAVASVGPRDGVIAVFLGRQPRGLPPDDRAYGYLGYPALVVLATEANKLNFGIALREHVGMLIRHELGHCFGMPHSRSATIMNPVPSDRKQEFGELELDILRATRTMNLGTQAPFVNCDLETLRDVFLILADRGEMDTALLINLGVAFYRERQLEDARQMFTAALRHDNDSLPARLGMAQTATASGDLKSGRYLAEGLSAAKGLTAEMQGALGGVWLQLGEYDKAEACLNEAMASGPAVFGFLCNRGLVRFHQDRFAEAKADFTSALGVEERPEGWFNLGLACDALEESTNAIEAFERYLALIPEGKKSEEARKFLERHR